MTAKQALSRPAELNRRILFETESLATLRAVAEGCTHQLTLAGCDTSPGSRGAGEGHILNLAEKEDALREMLRAFAEAEQETLALIGRLEDSRQRRVLMMHYISGMTYRQIGKELFMGRTSALRLHRQALANLTELCGFEKEPSTVKGQKGEIENE